MITILAFLVAIAILVVFHELGHYWVARLCGVKVLRFSVGFGKILYRKQFKGHDTEWAIAAIPLGGYVKMLDEREDRVAEQDLPYAFNRQPVGKRMAIVAAGPIANFILAIVFFWLIAVSGMQTLKPVIAQPPENTPAAAAGLQGGEQIVAVNQQPVQSWQQINWEMMELVGSQPYLVLQTDAGREYKLMIDDLTADDLNGGIREKLGLLVQAPEIEPVIGRFTDDSVAQQAGMQVNDKVIKVNQQQVDTWSQLVAVVRDNARQELTFQVLRNEQVVTLSIQPVAVMEGEQTVGKIGAAPSVDPQKMAPYFTEVRYGVIAAIPHALQRTWDISVFTLKMIGKMIVGQVSLQNLSGPITIADYAGQTAKSGWAQYVFFLALISISIGIFNLLPIPLLDGGHLLYYAVELVKGSPVSEDTWILGQKIGIALLGTIMFFAIFNDLNRLLG